MLNRVLLAIFATSLTSLPAATGANLLTNGSFETAAGGGCVPGPPNHRLPGWTVAAGTVDIVDSSLWQGEDGNISIDLDGFGNGAIEQNFATQSGQAYQVTFWLAGNFAAAPAGGQVCQRLGRWPIEQFSTQPANQARLWGRWKKRLTSRPTAHRRCWDS